MQNNNAIFGNNNLKISPSIITQRIKPKQKVLVWSDCVLATTGFGTVSRHILKALYESGRYEIDQLAINYFGDFYDKNEIPYTLVPAKLNDPNDPYGNQMFVNSLLNKDYDIVFIINDTFVTDSVARHIQEIKDTKRKKGQKIFKLIYYYPVDCKLLPNMSTMIKIADRSVAYTNFAKESSERVGISPTDVIYHGTDIKSFSPIPKEQRRLLRKRLLNVDDDDKFILINVNRNSMRKDIARTIYAFSEFRKQVPNSLLYIHAKILDGVSNYQIDLKVPIDELGLDITKDVIFPTRFHAAKGFPIQILNQFYNCADAFLTTHLGEGFGLTITEAMACGIPVIAPDNTTSPEILGKDRGYTYPCKEIVYIDNSGYRPVGRMEDILAQMKYCYSDWKMEKKDLGLKEREGRRQKIIQRALDFVYENSWDNICKQWIKLFDEVIEKQLEPQINLEGESL